MFFSKANSFGKNSNAVSNEVIVFSSEPRTLQLFARDNNDSALVSYKGTLFTPGYDSVYLEVYKNSSLWKRKSSILNYNSGAAPFELSQKIHAELTEYYFKLYIKDSSGQNTILVNSADSIVCGDAYIITGQSNSHNSNDTATFKNEFCRSFGIQTADGNRTIYNPADTNWGLSSAVLYQGEAWTGPFHVGVWGLYIQKQILDSNAIPTCIINGGTRASPIEIHLRNNSNPTDLSTIYGRLLYRVQKSGLAQNIKAIFWYQGEANGDATWVNYENNFGTLYNSWKMDYPDFKKIFLFQVRHGCNGNTLGGNLREVQRKLQQKYSRIELVSTMGIQEHGVDHCHYGFQGYYQIAVNAYKIVAKNFYSIANINDISPPNIKFAYYTTPAKNEIGLIFDNSNISSWPADTLAQKMRDYFYLNGSYGNVSTGIISGNVLKLQLIAASSATKLTYLPSKYYNNTFVTYEGPFIKNSRKIAALSFVDFPITNYPPITINLTYCLQGYYNPVLNSLNMRDTVTLYLRDNFFPYLIKDSSRAIIDSVSLTGVFNFGNTGAGTYYLATKTRNGIETWSSNGGILLNSNSQVNYNFTSSASQSFASNAILIGNKYCIYSGDVNYDGTIDVSDIVKIFNDAILLTEGYVNTDLNGDLFVDVNDLAIAYNNSLNVVTAITP